METTELLDRISLYSQRPEPFAKGTGNIWTEPYLASQMLQAHLSKDADAASRNEKAIERAVSYISNRLNPGDAVLDLGCGPGLYAEQFAKRGYHVTGVDFSENSIQYAADRSKKHGTDIEYRHDDFFNLKYRDEFDAVLQIYGEINTFSDADRDRLFQIIRNALEPGGIFVCDVTTANRNKGKEKATSWYPSDGGFFRPGKHLVLESTLLYENDVRLEQYIVADAEQVVVYRNWFHEYTPDSISKALLEAGFSSVEIADGLYGEEQQEGNWLTVIAKK